MKANVCLVCLKTFDAGAASDLASGSEEDGIEGIRCGAPLFTKFLKFTENYLHLPSVFTHQLLLSGGEKEVFCEKCELSVITPICQVYLQLLSANLRLSSELDQLGKLLDNSKVSGSDKLRILNINTLSNQLGIRSLSQLEGFRTSLAQKCRLKRKQALPNVLLTSRCDQDEIGFIENEELSCHENSEAEQDWVDPLAIEAADDNSMDLESDWLSSNVTESDDGLLNKRIPIGTGPVIKLEPFRNDSNPEVIYENENDDQVMNSSPELIEIEMESIPIAEDVGRYINGIGHNGHRCPECSKVMKDEIQYHSHYRYNHQSLSCNICGKAFKGRKLLTTHFKRLHQQRGIYPCKLCSRTFETAFKVSDHVTRFHRNEQFRYHCPHPNCNVSYRQKQQLEHHMIVNHEPESHHCPYCLPGSKVFPIRRYLRRHISTVHPEFFVSEEPNPRFPFGTSI
ncbi:unnamed protein product [Orchesella dallaii]|uniref:C2H2-type domain-containing protein n=1 Tax=Orchesella dallaii TaxID=48710 RepID=A0ABP1SAE0_9HEXA